MMPELFRKYRVLFYKDGCRHCRLLYFIQRMNGKLPVHKRIKMIECSLYDLYKIPTDPLQVLFSGLFSGYPTTFIDGEKIDGANSTIESEEYYKSLLEEDFTIPEQSTNKFLKDCEYAKKGLFKNKVICVN